MFSELKEIFKGQLFHAFLLYFLLAGIFQVVSHFNGFLDGSFWGIETKKWFFFAVLSPILHQVYVWVVWRFEWHRKLYTSAFGEMAFPLYKAGFTLLILSRPFTIVCLALSNENTLPINPYVGYVLSALLAIPAVYTMISVRRYFGFDRAFGIDHFYPENVRNLPMVDQGIFKYSPNAMYAFGFLMLYIPAFIWLSKAALLLALFNHLYIWVHYYFTEKPDMELIYEKKL